MSDPSTGRLDGPPAPTVWPSVGFADVDAGVRFLTEGLGFVVTALHRDGAGTVEHAEARWPDGGAWHRVRTMHGIEVLQELHDTDYGSHQFDVRDSDGNLWTVGTYRGA